MGIEKAKGKTKLRAGDRAGFGDFKCQNAAKTIARLAPQQEPNLEA
jgi:hypothetical protein